MKRWGLMAVAMAGLLGCRASIPDGLWDEGVFLPLEEQKEGDVDEGYRAQPTKLMCRDPAAVFWIGGRAVRSRRG